MHFSALLLIERFLASSLHVSILAGAQKDSTLMSPGSSLRALALSLKAQGSRLRSSGRVLNSVSHVPRSGNVGLATGCMSP